MPLLSTASFWGWQYCLPVAGWLPYLLSCFRWRWLLDWSLSWRSWWPFKLSFLLVGCLAARGRRYNDLRRWLHHCSHRLGFAPSGGWLGDIISSAGQTTSGIPVTWAFFGDGIFCPLAAFPLDVLQYRRVVDRENLDCFVRTRVEYERMSCCLILSCMIETSWKWPKILTDISFKKEKKPFPVDAGVTMHHTDKRILRTLIGNGKLERKQNPNQLKTIMHGKTL